MKRAKDCPECRLTAHEGPCKFCRNTRSIPLCPPVGETVVFRVSISGERVPMLVHSSERAAGVDGQAVVTISGWIPSWAHLQENVKGPSGERGRWNWKGEPS